MRIAQLAFSLSLVFALGFLPSAARADGTYLISIDGRPLTSNPKDSAAVVRDGVGYVDAVRFTKAFNGLVTFTKKMNAMRLTIDHRTADFLVGRASMERDGKLVPIAGAPFMLKGDLYLPLTAIAAVARAKVYYDKAAGVAHITTRARVPAPMTNPSVAPTGS